MFAALLDASWDVFLALIPVVLGYSIYGIAKSRPRGLARNLIIALLGLAWIAFLPNTCYLLTEWRHFFLTLDAGNLFLRSRTNRDLAVVLMAYTAFYFCFSGVGMLAFVLAIRPIARLAKKTGYSLFILGMPLFLMLSIGVYLGLILRYNSWDLITNPDLVLSSIISLADRPVLSAFIFAFGGFLWLAYLAIDIWVDGIKSRLCNKQVVSEKTTSCFPERG